MKRSILLFIGLSLILTHTYSQNPFPFQNEVVELKPSSGEPIAKLKSKSTTKAYLDTIFYEDFDSTAALAWSISNAANNNNQWTWVPGGSVPGGQFSGNVGPLQSTSTANGYMMLRADSFNTPTPSTGPVPMDTWFTSPAFNINTSGTSIIVKYEHALRYCCSSSNELVLEASTDGVNWTTYDANLNRGPSTAGPNGEVLEIDISPTLRDQSVGYIRFRSTGNPFYYWMIDDVLVYEGARNNMQLTDWDITFHDSYQFSPIYTIIPASLMPPTTFSGIVRNAGGSDQTNVAFNVEAIMDSAIGGGQGTGLAYRRTDQIGTVIPLNVDTANILQPFFTFIPGHYRYKMYVSSDSVNQIPTDAEAEYNMAITFDTTIALDNGPAAYNGTTGPPAFIGGGQDGDALAALMILDSNFNSGIVATSISYWVPTTRPNADGLQVSPRVWPWHEDSATLGGGIRPAVASSPFSTTIDTSMFGTWVSIPFFPPVSLAPGAYYFGLEQTGGGANGAELWAGRDVSQETIAHDLSNVMFLNSPNNPSWGWARIISGIRFNFYYTSSNALGEEKGAQIDLKVYPNPNNGLFDIKVFSEFAATLTIKVRNTLGQTVMTEEIKLNGNTLKQMDLSAFEKGVYFISLENGEERIVRKVVVN